MGTTFADAAAKAPYRARTSLDLPRLKHLVSSLFSAAARDHVWALREDPSYFAEEVEKEKDHSPEMVPDQRDQIHECVKTEAFMSRVLNRVVMQSHTLLIFWDQLLQQMARIEEISRRYPGGIDPVQLKTNDYAKALAETFAVLFTMKIFLEQVLSCYTLGAPTLRPNVYRNTTMTRTGRPLEDCFSATPWPSLETDEDRKGVCKILFYLTGNLKGVDSPLRPHEVSLSLDCLDTLIRKRRGARQWISSLTEWALTQFSIVVECVCHCELQPSYWKLIWKMLDDCEYRSVLNKPLEPWKQLLEKKFEGIVGQGRLGDPSDGKFNYPKHRARNQENVEAMQKAEENLDRFWNYVDDNFQKCTGNSQHETIRRVLTEGGALRRTCP